MRVSSASKISCRRFESGFPTSYGHPTRGLDLLDFKAVLAPISKRPPLSMRLFTAKALHPPVRHATLLRAAGRCGSIVPTAEA
jgi:hypothetical protein